MPDTQRLRAILPMVERRSAMRVRERATVFIEVAPTVEAAARLVPCRLINLSSRGMRLRAELQVAEEALLNLMVKFPGGAHPLRLIAEVRWCEPIGPEFDLGLALEASHQSELEHWQAWVNELELAPGQ